MQCLPHRNQPSVVPTNLGLLVFLFVLVFVAPAFSNLVPVTLAHGGRGLN